METYRIGSTLVQMTSAQAKAWNEGDMEKENFVGATVDAIVDDGDIERGKTYDLWSWIGGLDEWPARARDMEGCPAIDCGTAQDLAGDTAWDRAERAHIVAVDTATSKRFAEEKDFRDRHGWGRLLTPSQFQMMNRFVDRVMLDSVEMERVRETRKALYATPRGGSR